MPMTAEGYAVEATLTDTELRARGTTKISHAGLIGKHDGPIPAELVLPLEQIATARHERPRMGGFVNGRVVLVTREGREYQLHYRARKQAAFGDFADALVAATS